MASAEPLMLHDQVLQSDTNWSGEVVVAGVVVVGRQATLRIEPGTTVHFKKIDRNQDGIGDGEIRVLGRLLAAGNEERPIRFASAEQTPEKNDWSYVLIFTSGRPSELRYCEFSHAYTGLQVHFSTARVADCLFRDNHEGLRFGRADLVVRNCQFKDNDTAIRFTRMEGPAEISHNEISGNGIGIFVAPSGQNIRDFFDPGQSGKPWNTGRLTIKVNNICGNSRYNLDLGEKQIWDLDVNDNWWGAAEPGAIGEKIFDGRRDPGLGKALYLPAAPRRIEDAGIRHPR